MPETRWLGLTCWLKWQITFNRNSTFNDFPREKKKRSKADRKSYISIFKKKKEWTNEIPPVCSFRGGSSWNINSSRGKEKKRSIRTANLFYLILMRRKTKKKKYNQAWVYTLPIILWKFDRAGLVWSASLGAAAFLLLFLVLLWPEIDT